MLLPGIMHFNGTAWERFAGRVEECEPATKC